MRPPRRDRHDSRHSSLSQRGDPHDVREQGHTWAETLDFKCPRQLKCFFAWFGVAARLQVAQLDRGVEFVGGVPDDRRISCTIDYPTSRASRVVTCVFHVVEA